MDGDIRLTGPAPGFQTDPSHFVDVEPTPRRVRVQHQGEIIADSLNALVMLEKNRASKMVRLGSLQKRRVESPVAEGPTKIDLSYLSKPKRNVTLKVVSKPKPSWADMAEEDDADGFYDEDGW